MPKSKRKGQGIDVGSPAKGRQPQDSPSKTKNIGDGEEAKAGGSIEGKSSRQIKKPGWENIVAALIILAFAVHYAGVYMSFKQIPGPMYGGDYYLHYGIMNHIYNGNAPWTCSEYQGHYAFHPWLLHLAVASIAWATGSLLGSFLLFFPLIVVISCGILSYLLGRELFKEKFFAVLLCFGYLATRSDVGYIPANFTPAVTTPLMLLGVYKGLRTRTAGWIAAGGVSFGLFAMSHIATLPPGALLLGLCYLYYTLEGNVKIDLDPDRMRIISSVDKDRLAESFKKTTKVIAPMAVIGFIIALAYWGPVFFIYRFDVKNAWGDYAVDFASYGAAMVVETVESTFFNIEPIARAQSPSSIAAFTMSILTLIGLIAAVRNRREQNNSFIIVVFLTGFLGSIHYLVTLPLLNATYSPQRIAYFILAPAAYLLMFYGMNSLYGLLRTGTGKRIFMCAAILILLPQTYDKIQWEEDKANRWTELGRTPQNPATTEMASWVRDNTDKNAVFLSIEELSFALNGLTGRKLVVTRRTHSNPYVDINARLADAAVMLYGNNEEKTLQLLKAYNVSYLYWDGAWPAIASREPTLVPPEYKSYLQQYGISYKEVRTYLDPAFSDRYKMYDMLMVVPASNDPLKPWSKTLDAHLTQVKAVDIDGQAAYRIYKVDYGSA